MKIGILTFHNAHNYGAVLQAYALCTYLQRQDYDVHVLNYINHDIYDQYSSSWLHGMELKYNVRRFLYRRILRYGSKRERKFNRFISDLPLTRPFEEIIECQDDFDVIITGSDQVWNKEITKDHSNIYFLQGFSDRIKKVSYAASCGNYLLPEEIGTYLKQFSMIGVREKKTQAYIQSHFNINSYVTPDPTILLSAKVWNEIEEPVEGLPSRYLLFYTVSQHKTLLYLPTIKQISASLQLPIVFINYDREKNYKGYDGIDYNLSEIGPRDFVWLFHHATYVIPQSFHGNMFSLIFHKQFASLIEKSQKDARIETLHDSLGLGSSRLFTDYDDFLKIKGNIDYSQIQSKMDLLRLQGTMFLNKI